jgi:hypothetical protein
MIGYLGSSPFWLPVMIGETSWNKLWVFAFELAANTPMGTAHSKGGVTFIHSLDI